MANEKEKESVLPDLCLCGTEAVWSKAKAGYFYACPACLIRGPWRKSIEEATAAWNAEVKAIEYERSKL